jgi:glycosyltransferase involved in cell wall biosynthesis
MKQNPLISVVMPAYNSEKTVGEAIKSVLKQTYRNFEFIIVDDGSTDRSLEIIKIYARKDRRIKILHNKKNEGIAKTRNYGIKKSKGKYIAVQDSDDISSPRRFEKQVDFLEKNPDVGVVGSFIEIFDNSKKIRDIRKYPKEDKKLREMIFFVCPIAQPSTMIRKETLEKVGLYDKKYPLSEDIDLWFRIGEKYKFSNIQEVLLKYRENPKSATGSKTKLIEKLANEIRWKNRKNPAYNFSFLAFMYNLIHRISIYIIPSKFKLWIFRKIRDNSS